MTYRPFLWLICSLWPGAKYFPVWLVCPHLVIKDFIIWPALFVFFSSCCLHLRRPAYTELCNHLWHHCHHCFSSSKGFDFFKIFFIKFTSRDLLVLGKIIITIIIIIIIIEIIGLSGIQFGLLSYKWLIQSVDFEVGVGYINVNTKSCHQFIKTDKFEKETRCIGCAFS